MKYTIVCDVPSSDSIRFFSSSLELPECNNGSLAVVPYSPSVSELTQADRLEVISVFFMLVLLGYLAGIGGAAIISFIFKSLGWRG